MNFLLWSKARQLCLLCGIPFIVFATESENSPEVSREKAASQKCMSSIGSYHQYILHNWARAKLGVDNDDLFTDYYYTTENKDDRRGVPIHYDQSPEAMEEKIIREINIDKENPGKVQFSIEEKNVRITITRLHPFQGTPPDPNASMVTDYIVAADKTQLDVEKLVASLKTLKVAEALRVISDAPGNDGKFPLIVKSKKRYFNNSVRDIDKTLYSQNSLQETFEKAAKHTEREVSENLLKKHIEVIQKNSQGKSDSGLSKLAFENPATAENFLKDEVERLSANLALVQTVKNQLKSCFQTEPGWQTAIRLRLRDDQDYQRHTLLSIDILRQILAKKNEEMRSGYIVGPMPETIPWNPETTQGPLKPIPNPYHIEEGPK